LGKAADIMEKFVTKGKEIAIEGKNTQELWWQNGEKRYVTEVVVTKYFIRQTKLLIARITKKSCNLLFNFQTRTLYFLTFLMKSIPLRKQNNSIQDCICCTF
jgi:23S rRNA A1618 N6-methylase RlmF